LALDPDAEAPHFAAAVVGVLDGLAAAADAAAVALVGQAELEFWMRTARAEGSPWQALAAGNAAALLLARRDMVGAAQWSAIAVAHTAAALASGRMQSGNSIHGC
jgi:hypothetical protein